MGFDPGGRFSATNAPVFCSLRARTGEFQRPLVRIAGHRGAAGLSPSTTTSRRGSSTSRRSTHGGSAIPGLLRTLLEERFALKAHRETRQIHLQSRAGAQKTSLGPKMTPSHGTARRERGLESVGSTCFRPHPRRLDHDELARHDASSASERVVVDKSWRAIRRGAPVCAGSDRDGSRRSLPPCRSSWGES